MFDGISCGQVALERTGIHIDNYFASEVDKHAIKVTQTNYPNTIQLGDVTKWRDWNLPKIDLLIGGSPCQGFSFCGKGLNFDDPRSKLFFEFVDVLKAYKPKYFLLENVIMKKEYQDIITSYLNVEPIVINSRLVSAQNRERIYWTNIHGIDQPNDKGIHFLDILELKDEWSNIGAMRGRYTGEVTAEGKKVTAQFIECRHDTKTNCLTTVQKNNVVLKEKLHKKKIASEVEYRYLTPIESERLQTLPDNYTSSVPDSHRYKMLGNGWTADIIAHIFKHIALKEKLIHSHTYIKENIAYKKAE